MKIYKILFILTLLFICVSNAQNMHSHSHERIIDFPDIPGYKTLTCDLHQHSVFSDGEVWPSIRVQEALKDGLEAISITEHLEYQPHKDDIPHPDRNRSYEIAKKEAEGHDLMVINGAEITREMPPGHANAIFLKDANLLNLEDVIEAFREANKQGAFTFWNHPNWIAQRSDGVATLTDLHRQLINEGLLHGIEVVNEHTYSDEALQIALDHNLTIMGTSDIHGLIDWQFKVPEGGHRPITLVFAKEHTEAELKEGLKQRRTVVWFNNLLIGSPEFLVPLIESSIVVKKVAPLSSYKGESLVEQVTIENVSDTDFILENISGYTLHNNADVVEVKAKSNTIIEIKTLEAKPTLAMRFRVLNAVTAPNTHPEIMMKIR
ncbi:MAG: PHP domain-containing protein [Bacteroidia bacterium]|nr:PHP domain-containing protein [Bacteroidia bacterium]